MLLLKYSYTLIIKLTHRVSEGINRMHPQALVERLSKREQ